MGKGDLIGGMQLIINKSGEEWLSGRREMGDGKGEKWVTGKAPGPRIFWQTLAKTECLLYL